MYKTKKIIEVLTLLVIYNINPKSKYLTVIRFYQKL